ncbi:regulatory protein [Glaciecola nitratireducens FR1064]|uniref:Regulatory protein RecX n=2 Tax=Brumicola TaxID=3160924 RepID=G4QLT8_GLANF|nr:regulatory protein [Glaciecola nitratireducens FR1064]
MLVTMSDNDAKIIRHKLTRLLSRREHSQTELRKKLSDLEISADIIDETIKKFAEKDIQSDLRFAEAVVRGAYYRGKGPVFIERELNNHNIDFALVRELVNDDDFDWFESSKAVRVKRFGEDLPDDWTAKQKQMRFLQYRGFAQEQIKYAFE